MTLFAVTGATGFIGAALIDQLLLQGVAVRALPRDRPKLKQAGRVEAIRGHLVNERSPEDLANGAGAFHHRAGETGHVSHADERGHDQADEG